jgi:hypothetical protein
MTLYKPARRIPMLCVIFGLSAMLLSGEAFSQEEVYRLVAVHSGKCLVFHPDRNEGVFQYDCLDDDAQLFWILEDQRLRNTGNGACLGIGDGSRAVQEECNDGYAVGLDITPEGQYYFLRAGDSCLGVEGGSINNRDDLRFQVCQGFNAGQLWEFR